MSHRSQGPGGGAGVDQVVTLAALRNIPDVHDAVVTEHVAGDGHRMLLGYVTGLDPALGSRARDGLAGQLPDYLVPDHLVVLDEFPLTPDGDYDLRALPVPHVEDSQADGAVAPRTPTERRIASMIEQLLPVDGVGVGDSFFAMGGSSILATRLAFQIREAFDVDLSLPDVLASPTVGELAQLVDQAGRDLPGASDATAELAGDRGTRP